MACLLDVNILIALIDDEHPHRPVARNWFVAEAAAGWAACPLVENAVLRIFGSPGYPTGPGNTNGVRTMLEGLCRNQAHQFWSDDLSLMDRAAVPTLPGSKHLTDAYLLALAVKHRGKFVTLDRRIDPALIPGGESALLVLTETSG